MVENQVSYGDAFSAALTLTPDLRVAARATDGDASIELCNSIGPDLVVCDYRLSDGETGTEVAARLRDTRFDNPIVLLTGFGAPQVRREATAIENVFLLSKDHSLAAITAGLRAIIDGKPLRHSYPDQDPTPSELAPGELEVLELLNTGMSPTEIGIELHLSLHSIRSRIKQIHRKLGVKSQTEAIVVGTRRGLLVPPA